MYWFSKFSIQNNSKCKVLGSTKCKYYGNSIIVDDTAYRINKDWINISDNIKIIYYNLKTKKLDKWCKKYEKHSVLYISSSDLVKIISADHNTQIQTIYLNYLGSISAARTFITSELPDIGVYNVEFEADW